MTDLIIGHRGFVGSNLAQQIPDAHGAGRAEITALFGSSFGNIYCAAPQAKKWWANQNPEEDLRQVQDLISACRELNCTEHFFLLSTVDVYDPPLGVDELNAPSSDAHPYGTHRFFLENELLKLFGSKARVLRLPALVGKGLKKNIIYDLINYNNVNKINPNSSFQWFNLSHLKPVLSIARDLSSDQILNVATEPTPTRAVLERWFPDVLSSLNWSLAEINYDFRTIHGPDQRPYLYSMHEVMEEHLGPYIENPQSR